MTAEVACEADRADQIADRLQDDLSTRTELDGSTYRVELIESWRQEGRLGEPGSAIEQKRISLLFGDGGVYKLQDYGRVPLC